MLLNPPVVLDYYGVFKHPVLMMEVSQWTYIT